MAKDTAEQGVQLHKTDQTEAGRNAGRVKSLQRIGIYIVLGLLAAIFIGVISNASRNASGPATATDSNELAYENASGDGLESSNADAMNAGDAAGSTVDADRASSNAEHAAATEAEPDFWSYSEDRDELRNSTVYQASVTSNNKAYFAFPYAGGSTLRMAVRQHPSWGRDVYFQISSGQFICDSWDGCKGMISFDGEAESLTLVTPEGHDPKVLFARYDGAILRKLKDADRVVVELPFYQAGRQQFTFDTAGLKWDH